jgi:hypothetical protein
MTEGSFPSSSGRTTRLSEEEHQRRLLGMQYRWKIPRPPKKKRHFREWPNTPVFSELISHWKIEKTNSEQNPKNVALNSNKKVDSNKTNNLSTTHSVSRTEKEAESSFLGATSRKNDSEANFHLVDGFLTMSPTECENVRRRMSIATLCS